MGKRAVGVVVVLFLAGIVVGLPAFLPVFEHNVAVHTYEETEGVVDSSEYDVRERGDTTEFRPVVEYEYTVAGETHTAYNVYPGQFERWNDSEEFVNELADDYLEGDSVVVHYDPDDPGNAYVREAGMPGTWRTAVAYAVAAAVGGFWLFRTGRRHWRRRERKQNAITDVDSLTTGAVEIEGEARTGGMEPAIAPFSREGCLVAKYEIEQYESAADGDEGSWKVLERAGTYQPFLVDDGTGRVRVEPSAETTFDLDPEGWTTTRVESGERGPASIRTFVEDHEELDFPADAPGQENDRRYRQNLLGAGDTVYVGGVATSQEESSGERLAITPATDSGVATTAVETAGFEEPAMLVAERYGPDVSTPAWRSFWRIPAGAFFLLVALVFVLGMFWPTIGLPVPNVL